VSVRYEVDFAPPVAGAEFVTAEPKFDTLSEATTYAQSCLKNPLVGRVQIHRVERTRQHISTLVRRPSE